MTYTIDWARSAVRELRALPEDVRVIIVRDAGKLAADPRPIGCKKLKGHKDLWRIRVGNNRIVYFVGDRIRLVRIERIGHRSGVYR